MIKPTITRNKIRKGDFQCPPALSSLSSGERSLHRPGSEYADLSPVPLSLEWEALLKVGLGLLFSHLSSFPSLPYIASRRLHLASALHSLRARLLDFSRENTSAFLSPSRDLTFHRFSPRREKTTDRGYIFHSQSSLEVLVSPLLSREKALWESSSSPLSFLDLDFQCPPALSSLSSGERSLHRPGSEYADLSPVPLSLEWEALLKVGLGLLFSHLSSFPSLPYIASRRLHLASALHSLRARLLDFSRENTSAFLSPSRDLTFHRTSAQSFEIVLETSHFFSHHYRSQGVFAPVLTYLGEPFRPLRAITGRSACHKTPLLPHLAMVYSLLGFSPFPKCSVPWSALGSCILQVWNHGSALQPCKCPLCRRQITLLVPSEASSQQAHNSEASEILKKIEAYNRLFGSQSSGLAQSCLTLPKSHGFAELAK
ncbi:hypothetical protein CTI12_AA276180 [Artemisia annua]|uniref:Uncharacterized protein n=1 Tax=Artemisia annua TaxID=35608 RepID=A0A2U1NEY6_ARTAN|nr:hypothetical protein CTI12_AA276180 [Artemisia annua]